MQDFGSGMTGRGFRLRWVVASAAGMAVAGAVARPLSYLVGGAAHEALGSVVGEAVVGAVAGGGVLGGIALAQWLLLRQRSRGRPAGPRPSPPPGRPPPPRASPPTRPWAWPVTPSRRRCPPR